MKNAERPQPEGAAQSLAPEGASAPELAEETAPSTPPQRSGSGVRLAESPLLSGDEPLGSDVPAVAPKFRLRTKTAPGAVEQRAADGPARVESSEGTVPGLGLEMRTELGPEVRTELGFEMRKELGLESTVEALELSRNQGEDEGRSSDGGARPGDRGRAVFAGVPVVGGGPSFVGVEQTVGAVANGASGVVQALRDGGLEADVVVPGFPDFRAIVRNAPEPIGADAGHAAAVLGASVPGTGRSPPDTRGGQLPRGPGSGGTAASLAALAGVEAYWLDSRSGSRSPRNADDAGLEGSGQPVVKRRTQGPGGAPVGSAQTPFLADDEQDPGSGVPPDFHDACHFRLTGVTRCQQKAECLVPVEDGVWLPDEAGNQLEQIGRVWCYAHSKIVVRHAYCGPRARRHQQQWEQMMQWGRGAVAAREAADAELLGRTEEAERRAAVVISQAEGALLAEKQNPGAEC